VEKRRQKPILKSQKVRKVALISKEGHAAAKQVAANVAKILLEKGISVVAFPNLGVKGVDHAHSLASVSDYEFDVAVVVAGDGTILRFVRNLTNEKPIFTINVGGRGILADTKLETASTAIDSLILGNYTLEKRARIFARSVSQEFPPALNEVLFIRSALTRTPTFSIDFGESNVFNQRMDGLIVSTPTGTSGHSYSLGSPIAHGSLEVAIITPIAPLLRFPVLVCPMRQIKVKSTHHINLVVDGQETYSIEAEETVSIQRYKHDAIFVRLKGNGFFQLSNLGFK
jgi:NAD+ kinase